MTTETTHSSKKVKLGVILLDISIVLFAVFGRFITDLMRAYNSECLFSRNGWQCPTCGGTRCIESLLAGDFVAAFGYHQYFFCIAIYVLIGVVFLNIGYLFNISVAKKISNIMFHYKAVIVLAVLFSVFGILRMTGIVN